MRSRGRCRIVVYRGIECRYRNRCPCRVRLCAIFYAYLRRRSTRCRYRPKGPIVGRRGRSLRRVGCYRARERVCLLYVVRRRSRRWRRVRERREWHIARICWRRHRRCRRQGVGWLRAPRRRSSRLRGLWRWMGLGLGQESRERMR